MSTFRFRDVLRICVISMVASADASSINAIRAQQAYLPQELFRQFESAGRIKTVFQYHDRVHDPSTLLHACLGSEVSPHCDIPAFGAIWPRESTLNRATSQTSLQHRSHARVHTDTLQRRTRTHSNKVHNNAIRNFGTRISFYDNPADTPYLPPSTAAT